MNTISALVMVLALLSSGQMSSTGPHDGRQLPVCPHSEAYGEA